MQIAGSVRFVVVGLFITACTLNVGAKPSEAGVWHTHTWNMAMGNDPNNSHNQEKVDIVNFMVGLGTPWVANYQEMCRDQFDNLKPILIARGYNVVGFWPWSLNNQTQCNNTKLGTAVFIQGTVISGYTTLIKHSLQPVNSSGQDFAMVCRLAQNIGFRYFGCSTHMMPTPRDGSISAEAQILDSFSWWVNSSWSAYSTVFSGDLNHTYPTSTGTQQWAFVAHEMHLPTLIQTHIQNGTSEKIDYSFAGRGRFGRGIVQACTWLSNSDHKYCVGDFTI